jgi:hypothetical protein
VTLLFTYLLHPCQELMKLMDSLASSSLLFFMKAMMV